MPCWLMNWLSADSARSSSNQYFFFFQAEDGIRDVAVTGVQTCALPIFIKRGEYGALMLQQGHAFFAPAFPLEDVFDPTGAGDTFAGGVMGALDRWGGFGERSEEHTSELQSRLHLVCRLLLEKKKKKEKR